MQHVFFILQTLEQIGGIFKSQCQHGVASIFIIFSNTSKTAHNCNFPIFISN